MGRIWKVLTRKKTIDPVTAEETRLNRVLNTFDLTALGVGSTLGVGVYVLAGQVAKDTAGPSVVLSFLIAAVASVFAGLCYAEFGARTPKAGSAYVYSYVCVGEFVAFEIGWNLILEYVIGSASVARGLSLYLDTLINNTLQDTFREIAPINAGFLSPYFDFFSFGISILLAIALSFGLKESSMVNNIVTGLNILVVLFVIIAGSLKANPENWRLPPNNTYCNETNTTHVGSGGFFPFGVEGTIKGAATCFYGFVGFDCIATTGEEVKNPRKAIPISIIVSLFIIFLAYFGVSTVLTLMVPYCAQDHNAPIPKAFEMIGWDWAKWIVAIGALFGLCASLFGAMFPLPRIIYAMGSDGLVFKFLARVHSRFHTPVIGTLFAGVLTGLMAAMFDLTQLVNMMSIGTLLAYTIVAASVLLLRYKEEVNKVYAQVKTSSDTESTSSESSVDESYNDDGIRHNFDGPSTSDEHELINNESVTCGRSLKYIFNSVAKEPNSFTENIVAIEVFIYCVLCVALGLCAIYLRNPLLNGEVWAISIVSVIVGLTIILIMSLVTQPTSKKELSFKVPFVPLIPALSILVNIYLMLMLDYMTWIRFAVWMAIGIPMYCMRACVQKRPHNSQNGTKYTTNITNGHSKMSNGISNPNFVHTETNGKEMTEKTSRKKAIAPPPPVIDQKENIDVQHEAVIAQLDEILDNEVAIAQLDDVLNDETLRISNRKLSAGTLSNMSGVASHFEDVVADVHCANVSTPVANPKNISFPSVRDNPDALHNNTSESVDVSEDLGEIEEERPSNASDENKVEAKSDEVLGNDINLSEIKLPSDSSEIEIVDSYKENSGNFAEISQKAANSEAVLSTLSSSQNVEQESENVNKYEDSRQNIPIEEAQTIDEESKKEPIPVSPFPSKDALKSVTLRHVKKEIKQLENNDNLNASDDNLKVGSEEYKNFIKNLDGKLKRMTVIPSFYPVPRKDVVVQPKEIVPNTDVIEENINQEDAKEKLKNFIESSLLGDRASSSPRRPFREEDRSKSVDPSLLERNLSDTVAVLEELDESSRAARETAENENVKPSEETAESLSDHKEKMANVFRSIRLKKPENKEDKHVKRRLSKSLGRSFNREKDRSEHKQKMDDIFKSINALGKQDRNNEKVE